MYKVCRLVFGVSCMHGVSLDGMQASSATPPGKPKQAEVLARSEKKSEKAGVAKNEQQLRLGKHSIDEEAKLKRQLTNEPLKPEDSKPAKVSKKVVMKKPVGQVFLCQMSNSMLAFKHDVAVQCLCKMHVSRASVYIGIYIYMSMSILCYDDSALVACVCTCARACLHHNC